MKNCELITRLNQDIEVRAHMPVASPNRSDSMLLAMVPGLLCPVAIALGIVGVLAGILLAAFLIAGGVLGFFGTLVWLRHKGGAA